jgi:CheY-like chemotaxis protein
LALQDLDKARAIYASLITLLLAVPGGAEDRGLLERIGILCDAAFEALNDVESRVAIRGVKSLARLLYSDSGHVGAEADSPRDAGAVRLQLMTALGSFRGRVDALRRRRPSRPELPPLAPRKSLRILLVEDNRDSAATLARLLEFSGYGVSVAYSALEGFEAAKRERPDVILCDIGLPDSNGFALAEALRADPLTSSAQLIAVTAYGKAADLERSREAGFALHLVKPVSPVALLQMLEETARVVTAQRPSSPS